MAQWKQRLVVLRKDCVFVIGAIRSGLCADLGETEASGVPEGWTHNTKPREGAHAGEIVHEEQAEQTQAICKMYREEERCPDFSEYLLLGI